MEHSPTLEKAITVYGQPENCSAACRRILEVMEEEARNVGKPTEISLKILAHNNLIGRIIGKQGGTIKKIMEVRGIDLVFVLIHSNVNSGHQYPDYSELCQ